MCCINLFVCGWYTIVMHCSMQHDVVMFAITSYVNQLAQCDRNTICVPSRLFLFSHTNHGAACAVWSHHGICIHSLCGMVNHHNHFIIRSWRWWFIHQINANALKQCGDVCVWCQSWCPWLCGLRVGVCSFTPNHRQALCCALGLPFIHFAPCQSPTTPSFSACHTPVNHTYSATVISFFTDTM